uniref:Uncharacterized protein n=1 Tax=Magnetococcus massalia (strain MO-1) TaxID=451514 RepID=A0A1S7LQ21_MAGMO|nr:protein of unknown function [Candidatus Magnetococcus massalia]
MQDFVFVVTFCYILRFSQHAIRPLFVALLNLTQALTGAYLALVMTIFDL